MSQEVVGVLGVEEVEGEEGVAELGPIAVMRKGEGVSEMSTAAILEFSHFHSSLNSPALVSKGGWVSEITKELHILTAAIWDNSFSPFQIGSLMLDWVEAKYDVTIVSMNQQRHN